MFNVDMLGSQDILFIVLAFCALWFTTFLCWLLYQAASLVRRIHAVVDEMKDKVLSLEETIMSMKRKFDGNIAVVNSVAEGLKRVIEALRSRN